MQSERIHQHQAQDPIDAAVREIAARLGETGRVPLRQIRRLIEVRGLAFVREHLRRALAVEAAGGMLTVKGDRRRTLGGVFFYLARHSLAPEEVRIVFPFPPKKKAARTPPRPLPLSVRRALAREVSQQKGATRTVKVTLIGRPGKVVTRENFVVTALAAPDTPPPLPRGLPAPPTEPQPPFLVYIAQKQWRRVAAAIRNPDDLLIVEGFLRYDPKAGALAVYASSTTTKLLQQALREAQRAASRSG